MVCPSPLTMLTVGFWSTLRNVLSALGWLISSSSWPWEMSQLGRLTFVLSSPLNINPENANTPWTSGDCSAIFPQSAAPYENPPINKGTLGYFFFSLARILQTRRAPLDTWSWLTLLPSQKSNQAGTLRL